MCSEKKHGGFLTFTKKKGITMNKQATMNADRFLGFAEIYDNARPMMPAYPVEVIKKYLHRTPELVIDLGCGTGLSTVAWKGNCEQVIGVEPSPDMLAVARQKEENGISFVQAYSHDLPFADESVDVVVCSQSFHWMNPKETLLEINRVLKKGGIFATVDADWPAVCNWEAELAYLQLHEAIAKVEEEHPQFKEKYLRFDKTHHLANIKNSGFFRYAREILFANTEKCNAKRFVELALSQGGLQSILKSNPEYVQTHIQTYQDTIYAIFQEKEFTVDFCYRMRIGIK